MSEVNSQTFLTKANQLGQGLYQKFRQALQAVGRGLHKFAQLLRRNWRKFLRHFTKWIDPKLEPYRVHRSNTANVEHPPSPTAQHATVKPHFSQKSSASAAPSATNFETPKTRDDLFTIIGSVPFGILSKRERETITNLLDLPNRTIAEIILPKSQIVYVKDAEILGPLTLDRLYRSGLDHFPVVNHKEELIGILHTAQLNNLEVRESSRADQLADPNIFYVRSDYTFSQTLDTFLRTSSQLLIVVDHYGKIIGLLSFRNFCQAIFGQSQDDFDRDGDRIAVAKRRSWIMAHRQYSPSRS